MGKITDFIKACAEGDIDTVKKFMEEEGFPAHRVLKYTENLTKHTEELSGFFAAAKYDQVEVLKLFGDYPLDISSWYMVY